ncbi:MAG: tRNA uridine-5-carboxymethylaminomethyl(34) synthesis GTPase MnmE [Acidobacteria bacterium]|nr:tRNA uridine-5-carboxymethylaminomethyl(34) synthesis GTPase MnmE [Acidobacteriota bacterium]
MGLMFSTTDTIVAVATPHGRGGLGVVRLSGPDAVRVAAELTGQRASFEPRRATFARLRARPLDPGSPLGDEVVVTTFRAPRSYTGEDVAEISAHGSPVVMAAILRSAMLLGARLAEPGEFTLRAFLNGKRDLVQAEAVADLIDAVTPLQARAAFDQLEGTLTAAIEAIEGGLFEVTARLEASLDFPEEGYHFIEAGGLALGLERVTGELDRLLADASRGRLVREGALVSIVGAPNAGKSSLFNALLNANRAIVTEVPGTTRDLLTERADIGGLSLALVDTAGIRETGDVVEREGVQRAQGSLRVSDLAIVVLDRSRAVDEDDLQVLEATAGRPRLVVVNKVDLPSAWSGPLPPWNAEAVHVSVRAGVGLDKVAERMVHALAGSLEVRDAPVVTNVRHIALLEGARAAVARARAAVGGAAGGVPEEFVLADLQDALDLLQEVTGRRTTDDLLRHIFERFCLGK